MRRAGRPGRSHLDSCGSRVPSVVPPAPANRTVLRARLRWVRLVAQSRILLSSCDSWVPLVVSSTSAADGLTRRVDMRPAPARDAHGLGLVMLAAGQPRSLTHPRNRFNRSRNAWLVPRSENHGRQPAAGAVFKRGRSDRDFPGAHGRKVRLAPSMPPANVLPCGAAWSVIAGIR